MRALRTIGAGLWAAAGLFVGHDLGYRILYRDGAARAHALEHSGHGWTNLLGPLVVIFLAGAAATTVIGAVRQDAGRKHRGRFTAFSIQAGFQLGAFMLLEVGERLAHGWSLDQLQHELFAHHGPTLLVVGIVVQLLCAAGAALLAAGLEALAARRSERPAIPDTASIGFTPLATRCDSWCGHATRGRAPPFGVHHDPIRTVAPSFC